LSQVSPIDLLQMLSAKQSTGILHLSLADDPGAIYMRDGDIIDAEHGKTLGLKALYRIVGVSEGSFGFEITDPARPAQIAGRTDNLLMEGMRQQDELNRFLENVLSLDDVLEFVPSDVEEQRPPLEVEVAGLIQRYRCLGDVLDHASSTDMEAAGAVADLMDKGQVFAVGTESRTRFVSPEMLGRLCQSISALSRPGLAGPARLVWFVPDERTASQFSAAVGLGVDGYLALWGTHDPHRGLPATMGRLNLGQGESLDMTVLLIQKEMAPLWRPFLVPAVGVGVVVPDSRFVKDADQTREMLAWFNRPLVYASAEHADLGGPELIRADPLTPDGAFQAVAGLIREIVRLGEDRAEGKNRAGR
jgi:hypothetical protein